LDRRQFLKTATFGALAPLVVLTAGRRSVDRRPNVLFVLVDDMPPHLLERMERTLSRFSDGANLTSNGYVAVPLCGPARAVLLSGRYQHSNGVTGNDGAFLQYREKGYPRTDMLSRVKAAGYRLGFFGKYINGYEFNNRLAHPAFGAGDRWVTLADGQGQKNYQVNIDGALRTADEEHTPYFGSRAESFIRNPGNAPWFCYLNWTDPHLPYKAQDITGSYSSPATKETDLSDKSDYTRSRPTPGPKQHRRVHQGQGGEVERLDGWMERLFRALEKTEQLGNTVVIFSSDNGFMTGEHGGLTKKALPYEESARVPFLVRGPGFAPLPGRSPLVSHVDITATVCAVAGADPAGLEGRDLRGLRSGAPWRERLLVEQISSEGAVWSMLREGPWCYVDFTGDGRDKELYNLDADPYELESMAGRPEHADTEAGLAARLEEMRSATGSAMGTAETA
jgi:arylsulfatase A-like enzyme